MKSKSNSNDLSYLFLGYVNMLNKNLKGGMKREYRFHEKRRWRFDFAWPERKVAVECDGGQYKALGGRHNTDGDREKLNNANMYGWNVFRFSGKQIRENPSNCIYLVEELLKNKGRE